MNFARLIMLSLQWKAATLRIGCVGCDPRVNARQSKWVCQKLCIPNSCKFIKTILFKKRFALKRKYPINAMSFGYLRFHFQYVRRSVMVKEKKTKIPPKNKSTNIEKINLRATQPFLARYWKSGHFEVGRKINTSRNNETRNLIAIQVNTSPN